MNILQRIKQIEEHFEKLTNGEFEENMVKAGVEHIKPSGLSDMKMITEDEIEEEINKYKYIYKNVEINKGTEMNNFFLGTFIYEVA